jgi:hypothetical protein
LPPSASGFLGSRLVIAFGLALRLLQYPAFFLYWFSRLPAADCRFRLPSAGTGFSIANCQLPIANWELPFIFTRSIQTKAPLL